MTAISFGNAASPLEVTRAVARASDETGVDFDYLMQTAMRESGLESTAKAKTSSASGLFQFIDQTWLSVVKQNGEAFGLGDFASAIETRADGRHFVSDPARKEAILAERFNPESAALMAGALTRDSENRMEKALGREVTGGELYISHFLGTSGAIDFIQATEVAPGRRAADIFPKAAAANKTIFYDESGRPKSVREVYRNLTAKHGGQGEDMPALPGDRMNLEERVALAPIPTPSAPAPYVSTGGATAVRVSSGYSRPVMELSPVVINILASLDMPATDETHSEEKKERTSNLLRGYAS
ncbi:MAG: lytic transglycosylase domain-containing protein [Parvibaculum sp.]